MVEELEKEGKSNRKKDLTRLHQPQIGKNLKLKGLDFVTEQNYYPVF